jgi:hypothetical protein
LQINELDIVELEDGREVTVVFVYEGHAAYECEDVKVTCTPSYEGDPSFTVMPSEIKKVVEAF